MKFKCDFTLDHYFETLEYAQKEFQIGPMKNFLKKQENEKNIFLRHDIDFSLDYALELAQSEQKHGFCSTYFILLHSDFYNPYSVKEREIIRKIASLGHEIGLHYDTRFLSNDIQKSKEQIKNLVLILEDISSSCVRSASPHIPSETQNIAVNLNELNILNVRGGDILKDIFYISDSGRYWRNGCMCNHLGNQNNIQILTHPIWWIENSGSIKKQLDSFIEKETIKLIYNIGDYKKMVTRLLIELNAPKENFEI